MKYKVGDRVRIKSLDWYNKNKDKNGNIVFSSKVPHFALCVNVRTVFTKDMVKYCGKVVTIENVWTANYSIVEGTHRDYFTDEMIEGLVEERTKFGTAANPIEPKSNANCLTRERVDELAIKIDKELPSGNQNVWELPDGYQFVDENGNVINATIIALEKKKTEYPKTYEECCKILGLLNVDLCFNTDYRSFYASKEQWKRLGLMNQFYQLLICRDAYWKIAGEEMGLGKPWEPDWEDEHQGKWVITMDLGYIVTGYVFSKNHILAFPTAEMRDAFYENFKELIESVKELL